MITAAIASCPRSFSGALRHQCPAMLGRLHWAVMNSIGLREGDIIHSPTELPIFQAVAKLLGIRWTRQDTDATIVILNQPGESELLSLVGRLRDDRRVIAYNDESQIDGLSMRSFDLATACLFDQQSRKVVRVFDGGNSRRVADYLHVELSEHTDSTLSMYASRIAALR